MRSHRDDSSKFYKLPKTSSVERWKICKNFTTWRCKVYQIITSDVCLFALLTQFEEIFFLFLLMVDDPRNSFFSCVNHSNKFTKIKFLDSKNQNNEIIKIQVVGCLILYFLFAYCFQFFSRASEASPLSISNLFFSIFIFSTPHCWWAADLITTNNFHGFEYISLWAWIIQHVDEPSRNSQTNIFFPFLITS